MTLYVERKRFLGYGGQGLETKGIESNNITVSVFERVKRLNLPDDEYAVFGSALLDVWGIREADDLDIIATPDLYARLKKDNTWEKREGNGFMMLVNGDACVTSVQDKPTDGDYNPNRVRLIKEAVMINGVPFVRVEDVVACKRAYDRPKDREDIKNIEEYMVGKSENELYTWQE